MSDIRRPDALAPVDMVPLERALRPEIRENERVVQAVQYLNRTEFAANRQSSYLTFAIDEATRRPVVKVVDRSTKSVLYQIPPGEVLRMAAEMRSAARAKPHPLEETAT
jgi:flagellar protein FlaG